MKEKLENMPVLVFLLIGIALGGYNYMGSLSVAEGLNNQIAQLNSQIQEKKDGLAKAQNASAEIPSMKEDISIISQTLSKATELMPQNTSSREVIGAISKEAKAAGVRVTQARPGEAVNKNYFDELPMEMEIEGSYAQLTLFMYQLSKQKLIIHAVDMGLTTKEVVDGQTSLKMSGKLVGFKYKEIKR